jgi:preprotein translocase subunit SecG
MAWFSVFLLKFMMVASAVAVIILVLLQKGKGGGLAGALGGMGGQSAFGTKAGDLFTKITIGVASVWILVCVVAAPLAPRLTGNPLNVTLISAPNQQTPGQQTPDQTPPAPAGETPPGTAEAAKPEKSGGIPEPSNKPTEKPAAPAT